MGAERERVASLRSAGGRPAAGQRLVPVGPVPERAPVGHGSRGLQRRRRGLGLPPARPRALAGVPLGRGRHGRASATSSSGCASSLALWNGRDPILKERMFGLTGQRRATTARTSRSTGGSSTPCPATRCNRWRYHYPQGEFPYADLVAENGRRGKLEPEYELLDTGAFDDDRYWVVEVEYAKADPHRLLMTVQVTNAGPRRRDAARAADGLVPQHLVLGRRRRVEPARCGAGAGSTIDIDHPLFGDLELVVGARARRQSARAAVLRQRDQRRAALRRRDESRRTRRTASTTTSCTAPPTVNPERDAAPRRPLWYQVEVAAGETVELRLRLRPARRRPPAAARARRSTQVAAAAPQRGRRVLRRADARRAPPPTRPS